MKLKRARRPQNMFLFDPDFRYRQVDEPSSSNAISTGKKEGNILLSTQSKYCILYSSTPHMFSKHKKVAENKTTYKVDNF